MTAQNVSAATNTAARDLVALVMKAIDAGVATSVAPHHDPGPLGELAGLLRTGIRCAESEWLRTLDAATSPR